MAHLLATVLAIVVAITNPAWAQKLVPEQELVKISDSIFSGDSEAAKNKCGEYFMYYPGEISFITANAKTVKVGDRDAVIIVMMQRRNVRTMIDNKKTVPTVEVVAGPQFILRISYADYEKSTRCLPKPPGA